MTAQDLIEELQRLPNNAPVTAVVAYAREGEPEPHPITVCEVTRVEYVYDEDRMQILLHTGREV